MPKYKQKSNNCKKDNADDFVRSNDDGSLNLPNPHLKRMSQDFFYHLGLDTVSYNLLEMFGDVKFICMGGTKPRMEIFANYIMTEIGHKLPTGTALSDISQHSTRYAMYKVGPVLCVSHGMGMSSMSIVLNEIIKLMYYAKVKDPIIFKVGTSGGFGIEKGTVVITETVVDVMMNSYYEMHILGKLVRRPAKLDINLVQELHELASDSGNPYNTISGTTMCTSDFYEEQGRIDGTSCDFEKEDQSAYLTKLHSQGVVNIEMQGIPFAAITHHNGIRAAIVCVTLLDKLEDDKVSDSKVTCKWQMRPKQLVVRYIKRYLQNNGLVPSDARRESMDKPIV